MTEEINPWKNPIRREPIVCGLRRLNSEVNKTQPITERNKRRLEKKKK